MTRRNLCICLIALIIILTTILILAIGYLLIPAYIKETHCQINANCFDLIKTDYYNQSIYISILIIVIILSLYLCVIIGSLISLVYHRGRQNYIEIPYYKTSHLLSITNT